MKHARRLDLIRLAAGELPSGTARANVTATPGLPQFVRAAGRDVEELLASGRPRPHSDLLAQIDRKLSERPAARLRSGPAFNRLPNRGRHRGRRGAGYAATRAWPPGQTPQAGPRHCRGERIGGH